MAEMTLSEKKEYARSLCQELYNLIDMDNDIAVRLTRALETFKMTWRQRIVFFLAKRAAGRSIQRDMKLVKRIELAKSALDMDSEDVNEDKVDHFIADLELCIANQKSHIRQGKTQLEELQKP